jgi:hypothetical protein
MKHFPALALAFLLSACAVTPEDRQEAHQRQLAKEARENFLVLKAQEHPGRAVVLHDEPAPPQPAPLLPFLAKRQPAPASSTRTKGTTHVASMPSPYRAPAPQPKPRRAVDDTVYYWQVQSVRQHVTPRQHAAEVRYARELAKRPEALSAEERLWAHEHY